MNDNALATVLGAMGAELTKIRELLQAQAEHGGWAPLYCRPSEEYHCPGGYPLRLHAREWWKNDGNDQDRLFHVLPESAWHPYEGKGELHGRMVRNHNVWRSEATTNAAEGAEPFEDESPEPAGEPPGATRGQSDARSGGGAQSPAGTPATLPELERWALEQHGLSRGQIIEILKVPPARYATLREAEIGRAMVRIIAAVTG